MNDIARGVLAGIAIGGFTAVVVKGNMIAMDAIQTFNDLATDMILAMVQATQDNIKLNRLKRAAHKAADKTKD